MFTGLLAVGSCRFAGLMAVILFEKFAGLMAASLTRFTDLLVVNLLRFTCVSCNFTGLMAARLLGVHRPSGSELLHARSQALWQ